MTPPAPPPPPSSLSSPGGSAEPGGGVDAAVLAGLAREVDGLRRHLDGLDVEGLSGRVDELAGLLAQLADTVTALSARRGPTPCPSWLLAPADPDHTTALLDELVGWLGVVYLRYSDGAGGLPECWLWHPDIIEELLWLMHAWCAAYQGPAASVGLVGDWHDRQRPGVVRRIRAVAGSCSREAHQTRNGWDSPAGSPAAVPALGEVDVIATWWGSNRHGPAPEPRHVAHAGAGPPAP